MAVQRKRRKGWQEVFQRNKSEFELIFSAMLIIAENEANRLQDCTKPWGRPLLDLWKTQKIKFAVPK